MKGVDDMKNEPYGLNEFVQLEQNEILSAVLSLDIKYRIPIHSFRYFKNFKFV